MIIHVAEKEEAQSKEKGAKAKVPSWYKILHLNLTLGVTSRCRGQGQVKVRGYGQYNGCEGVDTIGKDTNIESSYFHNT